MTRLLLALLVVFSTVVSAHEARVNPDQRRAIRERLAATGCLRSTAELGRGGATRGGSARGTRSVTRGPELPPEAEQYSNYFSQVIPAELDLPYGRPGDPKSHTFFRNDPHEGAEKIRVQEELGIRWNGPDAPSVTPTWIELATNYRAALTHRGIDPNTTFRPAMVLYRKVGQVAGKGGKMVDKYDYLFVDPLTESFPADMSQWKVLDKDTQFNIPFQPIFEAMQQGKFPLLDAVHDVSHFVSFLRFPEFAQTVRAQMQKAVPSDLTGAFKGREYWLTEALSLPDPAGQTKNHEFLASQTRPRTVREPAAIEKELGRLDEAALIDYALKQARHFESQLRDVSGGNSSAPEKWYYLSESFGMKAEDLVKENLAGSSPIGPAMGLGKVYFENAPITLNANPKNLTNETATFSFNTFVTAQKLIALSLKENREGDVSRKEALKQLVKFASRTEYLLTMKPFTYQEWGQAFLQADMPKDGPIGQMLMNVYGNDIVAKYYLGRGEARPKK